MKETNPSVPINYDGLWKNIIKEQFEAFIAFFLPEVYPLVDFSQAPQFLEQELYKIIADKIKKGTVVNDKLVRVLLKDGSEKWILIHIEVQDAHETNFAQRMFTYFYRIYDKYEEEVTALAVYTGEKVPKRYNKFVYQFLGTNILYEFNTYQVRKAQQEQLLKNKNPFAIVVLAVQYLHQTQNESQKRYTFKRKLVELALERKYTHEQILSLIKFIQLLLQLPPNLELQFSKNAMETLKNTPNMDMSSLSILAEQLYLGVHGETFEETLAKQAKQAEAEKAALSKQAEAEKAALSKQAKQAKQAEAEKALLTKKLLQEKITAAEKLLKETKFSVTQIAEILTLPVETVFAIKEKLEKRDNNGNIK